MTEATSDNGEGQGAAGGGCELAPQWRPLVGRDAELAGLRAALDAAAAGTGGLRLLAGEPGIGKTRLAEELAEYARGRAMLALWGSCGESSGAPAYSPWAQLLGAYVRGRDDDALTTELGAGAAQVAQILPELRARLPECGAAAAALSPEVARFALFDAVANFLLRASADRPLLLVLDDLHAADAASLRLLRFVAGQLRSARVLIIAAYRDVEAALTPVVAGHLDELLRDGRCLSLHGLAVTDLAQLIERGYGMAPAPELVADLHRSTRGNPFFVHVLLAGFLSADQPLDPARLAERSHWIPGSIHQAIRERLEHLGTDAAILLSAAAVSGEEFDVDVLERVTGCPRGELLDRLADPTMTRVVLRSPARPGRYAFAHALVREAVYQSLPPTRRAQLHGQIAAAIEAL